MTSGGNTVVSAVGYDAGSQPTGITYQAGSDTYQYDPNTGRMTLYKYTISNSSMQSSLTWNPNGTLKQLAITDGFFAGGTQTCNNTYNELAQLVSNNCGSVWSQTFTYDPFNNITKSGSSQWMPGYSQTNNRYQNGSTYDANGNLLYDTFNSYTWNDFNKPLTIVAGNSTPTCGTSGTCITYDAFDRVVELNVSGTFSQIYYGPANKGLMSGTTANQERVPLPGMGTYNQINGAFGHIWHSDWLGTSRFAATRAGTVIFDRAFAPYGEMYAANTGGTTEKSFTGDTQDTFAGLFDTPARELHPAQGRWISPDPAHAGVNAYAYTTNPLSMIDPSGLRPHFFRRWNKAFGSGCSGTEWSDCDVGFTVNGAEVPGWVGQGLLSNGIAAVCPGNVCEAGLQASDAEGGYVAWYQWHPGSSNIYQLYTADDDGRATDPVLDANGNPMYVMKMIIGGWGFLGYTGGPDNSFSATAAAETVMGMQNAFRGTLTTVPFPVTASVNEIIAAQTTWDQGSRTLCGNVGVGASFPPTKALTLGILNEGNMDRWKDVVSSWGYSFAANGYGGYQMSTNSSGTVGGPTLSGPGFSGSYTYGGCMSY